MHLIVTKCIFLEHFPYACRPNRITGYIHVCICNKASNKSEILLQDDPLDCTSKGIYWIKFTAFASVQMLIIHISEIL